MEKPIKTKPRGGKREGAGRKRFEAEKRLRRTVTLPPSVDRAIIKEASDRDVKVSEVVTDALKAWLSVEKETELYT